MTIAYAAPDFTITDAFKERVRGKVCGIYCITNIKNGKRYVGSSVSVRDRKTDHFSSLTRNEGKNPHLQAAFNAYGKESFAFFILEECTREELTRREDFFFELLKTRDAQFGYNIRSAERQKHSEETKQKLREASLGHTHTKEARKKISLAHRGNKYNLGRVLSDEHKRKIGKASKGNKHNVGRKLSKEHISKLVEVNTGNKYNLGRKLSEETKEKLREASKGNIYGLGYKHTEEAKKKIGEASKHRERKPFTEESKKRISESLLGRKLSDEHKDKIRKASTGRRHTQEAKKKIGAASRERCAKKRIAAGEVAP